MGARDYFWLKEAYVMINKDELAELMEDDKREEARREDLEFLEECRNDRDSEQQEKHDSGMCGTDFM